MKKIIPSCFALLLLTASSARPDLILSTFSNTGLDFTYGSWALGGAEATGPTFLTLQAPATESGGGGVTLASAAFDSATSLVTVTARLGAANLADGFNVILQDQDPSGTEDYGYRFDTAGLNSSTFVTLSVPVASFTFLNNTQDGVPNFDVGGNGLVGWQLQGDFSSTDTLNIEYDQLQITTPIPEPGTGLVMGLGLMVLLVRRRLRPRGSR